MDERLYYVLSANLAFISHYKKQVKFPVQSTPHCMSHRYQYNCHGLRQFVRNISQLELFLSHFLVSTATSETEHSGSKQTLFDPLRDESAYLSKT